SVRPSLRGRVISAPVRAIGPLGAAAGVAAAGALAAGAAPGAAAGAGRAGGTVAGAGRAGGTVAGAAPGVAWACGGGAGAVVGGPGALLDPGAAAAGGLAGAARPVVGAGPDVADGSLARFAVRGPARAGVSPFGGWARGRRRRSPGRGAGSLRMDVRAGSILIVRSASRFGRRHDQADGVGDDRLGSAPQDVAAQAQRGPRRKRRDPERIRAGARAIPMPSPVRGVDRHGFRALTRGAHTDPGGGGPVRARLATVGGERNPEAVPGAHETRARPR